MFSISPELWKTQYAAIIYRTLYNIIILCTVYEIPFFPFSQTLEFPLDYGLCTCSPPSDPSCSAIDLCETTIVQNLFTDAVIPSSSEPTLETSVVDNIAYVFSGAHVSENWVLVSDEAKGNFFEHVDNQAFTVSWWILLDSDSNAAYIFSFELGRSRYFSLYDSSRSRATFYYFRDALPNFEQNEDQGYQSQVALSFYYDPEVFPDGLRDSKWHFIALSVDFPNITLTVDGYVYRPTQGNYLNEEKNRELLDRDGSTYNMPAEILRKSDSVISNINGYIGGSARGTTFGLEGSIRQLVLTNYLETDEYNCLGSCNVYIYSDNSVSGFNTFFNPTKRSFEFSSSAEPSEPVGDTEYTEFMSTLIFSDNGFLPPEEEDELWKVSVQVSSS